MYEHVNYCATYIVGVVSCESNARTLKFMLLFVVIASMGQYVSVTSFALVFVIVCFTLPVSVNSGNTHKDALLTWWQRIKTRAKSRYYSSWMGWWWRRDESHKKLE